MECARFMAAFADGVKSVRVVKLTSWAAMEVLQQPPYANGGLTDLAYRGHGSTARSGGKRRFGWMVGSSVCVFLVPGEELRLGQG